MAKTSTVVKLPRSLVLEELHKLQMLLAKERHETAEQFVGRLLTRIGWEKKVEVGSDEFHFALLAVCVNMQMTRGRDHRTYRRLVRGVLDKISQIKNPEANGFVLAVRRHIDEMR